METKNHKNKNAKGISRKNPGGRRGRAGKAAILLILLFSLLAAGCGGKQTFTALEDFRQSGAKIGAAEGYVFPDVVRRTLPEAELTLFESREDAYRALLGGLVDGVADDEPVIRAILRSEDSFSMAEGYLEENDYAFIFPRNEEGQKLCGEMSAYLKQQEESGALKALDEKWFGNETDNKISEDPSLLPAVNGTLRMAFEDGTIPFGYLSAGRPAGYEVDLAIGFCRTYGYGLSMECIGFSELLSGTASGVYDAGFGAVTVTEERKQSLLFSEADYRGGVSICTRSAAVKAEGEDPASNLQRHFYHAFLEDQRYLLFLRGIAATLIMVLLAALFGTPFGGILYILTRRTHILIRGLVKGYLWILHGIPAIMLIMLLYYVYYRDILLGGLIASSIGFTLLFAGEVYRILDLHAGKVGKGKLEREYRVEGIETRAFFRILRIKAGPYIKRDYRESLVRLIKATSVVGFISVMDLTAAFDAIRKDSLETMLPLLATMAVYFLLIKLVTLLFRIRK